MVLSHTTGLPNWRPNGGPLEFKAEPGAGWIYSGEGFVLLQRVLEELTGDSLQGIATSLVFEPLEMRRSSYVWKPEFASNVAFPHDATGESRPNRHLDDPNAAYSLLTTASDYARFLAALMRGDDLSKETHSALQTQVVDVNAGVGWGLGLGLEENADGLALWHWGHNSGYRAYMISYPRRDLAVVYFANSDNGMRFLKDVISAATGDTEHPAIDHLDYPQLGDADGANTED